MLSSLSSLIILKWSTKVKSKAFLASRSSEIIRCIRYPLVSLAILIISLYIDHFLAKFNIMNAKSRYLKTSSAISNCIRNCQALSTISLSFQGQTSKLSKYNANLTTMHSKTTLHVLQYLKSTRNYCIV